MSTEDQKDLPLEVVEDTPQAGAGGPPAGDPPAAPAQPQEQAAAADERLGASDDDEDGDEGEGGQPGADGRPKRERLSSAERRRLQRMAKERDKALIQQLTHQNRVLAERLSAVERTMQVMDERQLDERLSATLNDYETAERVYAAAVSAQNGEDAAKALRHLNAAREAALALDAEKKRRATGQPSQQPAVDQGAPQPPKVNPVVVTLATAWAKQNPWFDPQLGNTESQAARVIDRELTQAGMRPDTIEYWAELDRRVKQRFPHLNGSIDEDDTDVTQSQQIGQNASGAGEQPQRRRSGPPVNTGSNNAARPGTRQIRLSPERVKLMQEMGVWDDPVKRAEYAKAYAEYDTTQNPR